jgi:hypothetical protein
MHSCQTILLTPAFTPLQAVPAVPDGHNVRAGPGGGSSQMPGADVKNAGVMLTDRDLGETFPLSSGALGV